METIPLVPYKRKEDKYQVYRPETVIFYDCQTLKNTKLTQTNDPSNPVEKINRKLE